MNVLRMFLAEPLVPSTLLSQNKKRPELSLEGVTCPHFFWSRSHTLRSAKVVAASKPQPTQQGFNLRNAVLAQ